MTKTLFTRKNLNDGTNGYRFDYVGFKGIYRKRIMKKRWGLTKGDTFRAIHIGKRSLYVEQIFAKRRLWDWCLRDIGNAFQLVFMVDKSRNH